MTNSPLRAVIEHLHAVNERDGGGRTDRELLNHFLSQKDEDALAALVHRHASMVWGVCCRLLHETHDAEDAFQATFLVLVRKAKSVPREAIANWLYGVARQTAVRVRSNAAKRGRRETQVMTMPEPAMPEVRNDELIKVVDEELSRLPSHYRGVVVLCDLEELTRKEAARQLGIPEGSVASRLARARALLTKRLQRRGIVFTGSLAAVISAGSASSAPPALITSTIKVATLLAAGQAAGVISFNVATLTEGMVKTMLLTKLKSAVSVVLILGVMATGTTLFYRTAMAGQGNVKSTAEKAVEPVAKQEKVKENEAFTAWGEEVDGLQAGLGFRSGEMRPYTHGETVTLVVRVRNVIKNPLAARQLNRKDKYITAFFIDWPPTVTDGDGKTVAPIRVAGKGGDYNTKELTVEPGKEVELAEVKLELRPGSESGDNRLNTLYGTGKFQVHYQQLMYGSGKFAISSILNNLATGKLELVVMDKTLGGARAKNPVMPPNRIAAKFDEKDLGTIKPQGGVPLPLTEPGTKKIGVDQLNKVRKRLESVPEKEFEKWMIELERIMDFKLADGLPSPRQACRTDFVVHMSLAFDELKWNATVANELYKRACSMRTADAKVWKEAFESLLKEKIGIEQTGKDEFSNLSGGPPWAVPLVLIPVDVFYEGQKYSVERGKKYLSRLKQLTKDDVALWRDKIDKFGGTKLDAAINIILLDEFFDKENFQRDKFKTAVERLVENKPIAEKPPEPYTAWGNEVGGLQAGLGYDLGEKRVHRPGETVKLVVRVRNVGREAVKFEYLYSFFVENPPVVMDNKGKQIPLGRMMASGKFDQPTKINLEPGKAIELFELKLELKPSLYATGKSSVQYERIFGNSSLGAITLDPSLSKLATGKLELEIEDGPPPAAAKKDVLTPEEVVQRKSELKTATVEFKVEHVTKSILITRDRDSGKDADWITGHGPDDLCLRPEYPKDRQARFLSILTPNAISQLNKAGIRDIEKHFIGKNVRVTGSVVIRDYRGKGTPLEVEIVVNDLSQFEVVEAAGQGNVKSTAEKAIEPQSKQESKINAPIPKSDNTASKVALNEAVELLKTIKIDPSSALMRCRLWIDIARLSMKLDDRDGAKQAVLFAEDLAKEVNKDDRGELLRDVAKEWGRLGEVAKVLEITSTLPKTDYPHNAILNESAQAAAESGHYEEALKIAKELPKVEYRDWLIKEIKKLDIFYRAKQGITEALLKEVDQLPDENEKIAIYVGRAVLDRNYAILELTDQCFFDKELAAGNRKQAIVIVQKAEAALKKVDNDNRLSIFMICRAHALLKDPQSIRKILLLFPPAPEKTDPKYFVYESCNIQNKAMLAAAEAAAGNIDAANDVVKEFTNTDDQVYILMYIGLALHKEGKTDQVKATFGKAHDLLNKSVKRSNMLHNLATAEAMCGDYNAAIATASSMREGASLSNIAYIMCKAGQYREARKLALKRVESAFWQGSVLMSIAENQTKAGQVQEVKDWIAEDDNPVRKAYATVGLAGGLFNEKGSKK